MRKPTLYSVAIMCLIVLTGNFSCKKEISERPSTDESSNMSTARVNRNSTVYLSVSISDGEGYKLKSDGKGAYVHGQQNVSARFDQYGNLQFDTYVANGRKGSEVLRAISFIFDDPCIECGTTSPANPIPNQNGNYRLVTQIYGKTPMQLMAPGETLTGIGLGGGFVSQTSSSTYWNFNFRYGIEKDNGLLTFVRVEHPTPNVWIMTGETANPVTALKTNGVLTGYYKVPFSLTLTSL